MAPRGIRVHQQQEGLEEAIRAGNLWTSAGLPHRAEEFKVAIMAENGEPVWTLCDPYDPAEPAQARTERRDRLWSRLRAMTERINDRMAQGPRGVETGRKNWARDTLIGAVYTACGGSVGQATLGRDFGLTKARVGQIAARWLRGERRRQTKWGDGLRSFLD